MNSQFFEVSQVCIHIHGIHIGRRLFPDVTKGAGSITPVGDIIIAKYRMINYSHKNWEFMLLISQVVSPCFIGILITF
jgi:hypothetical protein